VGDASDLSLPFLFFFTDPPSLLSPYNCKLS